MLLRKENCHFFVKNPICFLHSVGCFSSFESDLVIALICFIQFFELCDCLLVVGGCFLLINRFIPNGSQTDISIKTPCGTFKIAAVSNTVFGGRWQQSGVPHALEDSYKSLSDKIKIINDESCGYE